MIKIINIDWIGDNIQKLYTIIEFQNKYSTRHKICLLISEVGFKAEEKRIRQKTK